MGSMAPPQGYNTPPLHSPDQEMGGTEEANHAGQAGGFNNGQANGSLAQPTFCLFAIALTLTRRHSATIFLAGA